MSRSRAVAVVAAHDEEGTVGAVVSRLAALEGVAEVWVAADGCTDRTAEEAVAAGGRVLVASRRVGKGRAVEAVLERAGQPDVWLVVDGDVGETAAEVGRLLEEVRSGRADVAVGRFPPLPGGGFGLVKRMAARMVRRTTGRLPTEPLSGQRAVTAQAMEACRPLADGFGLETAMTADLARLGFRVVEVDVRMRHRATGRTPAGFAHRARQGLDILLAMAPRLVGLR